VFSVAAEHLRQVRERNLRTLRIDWTVGGQRAYEGRENTDGHACAFHTVSLPVTG